MRLMSHLLLALAAMPLILVAPARAQDNDAVYVVRYFEVAADVKERVPPMLVQLADESRKEQGVVRFDVLQRTAPSSQFAIVETWKDKAASDAHADAAPTKTFLSQIEPLLLAPIDSRNCDALDVPPPAVGRTPRGRRYVVTHVDVNPPNKDSAFTLLKDVAKAARNDRGNIRFDVLVQQVRNQNHFEIIEAWRNQKLKDAHDSTAATKDFRAKLAPLSGALYDQRWYRPL